MKSIQIGKHTSSIAQTWPECAGEQIQTLLPLQLLPRPESPGQAAILTYAAAKVLLKAPEKVLERLNETQKWRFI